MKKIIFPLLFLFAFIQANAQNKTIPGSFIIKELKDNSQLSFFTKSIEAANFEQYRLKEKSVMLEFSNGFKVELLSAKDCFVKGNQITINDYQTEYPIKFSLPTFFITETSHITAVYNNPRKN